MAQSLKSKRSTTWTFVCWPESLPTEWRNFMSNLHVPIAYILHDQDIKTAGSSDNPEDLKPHIHVLVRYDSLKSLEQVQADFSFTGIPYFEPVRSFKSMCRYLIHLDDADKFQYSKESITCLGGISLDFSRKYSRDEELSILSDITAFVEDNDIVEYASLWNYAAKNNYSWLDILAGKSSYGISQYIRSRSFSYGKKQKRSATA